MPTGATCTNGRPAPANQAGAITSVTQEGSRTPASHTGKVHLAPQDESKQTKEHTISSFGIGETSQPAPWDFQEAALLVKQGSKENHEAKCTNDVSVHDDPHRLPVHHPVPHEQLPCTQADWHLLSAPRADWPQPQYS